MSADLPLFVYGTLRDREIRDALLRRDLGPAGVRPAAAPGFRAVYYPGATYPALIPAPDIAAPGLALYGLTEQDQAIFDVYEGPEYRRDTIALVIADAPARAHVYLPTRPIAPDAPGWNLEIWNRDHRTSLFHNEAAQARKAVLGGEHV